MFNRSGQVLVLVLLVVVVALSIGLSVASRNITNLKTATQSERSQRAFSAAEGGVEDTLSKLNQVVEDIRTGSSSSGCPVSGTSATCQVNVGDIQATVDVKTSNVYESIIELGMVGQIDLKDYSGDIRIEWSKIGESTNPASIEVVEYFQPTSGTFSQKREAWEGFAGRPDESFTPPNLSSSICSGTFRACAVFTVDPSALGTGKYLRIRPFWSRATVRVSAVAGNIPLQTVNLESTAKTEEGITRKVLVTRNALPALPAAFDYALFSTGSIIK